MHGYLSLSRVACGLGWNPAEEFMLLLAHDVTEPALRHVPLFDAQRHIVPFGPVAEPVAAAVEAAPVGFEDVHG